jgi:hypothetical protein
MQMTEPEANILNGHVVTADGPDQGMTPRVEELGCTAQGTAAGCGSAHE